MFFALKRRYPCNCVTVAFPATIAAGLPFSNMASDWLAGARQVIENYVQIMIPTDCDFEKKIFVLVIIILESPTHASQYIVECLWIYLFIILMLNVMIPYVWSLKHIDNFYLSLCIHCSVEFNHVVSRVHSIATTICIQLSACSQLKTIPHVRKPSVVIDITFHKKSCTARVTPRGDN